MDRDFWHAPKEKYLIFQINKHADCIWGDNWQMPRKAINLPKKCKDRQIIRLKYTLQA